MHTPESIIATVAAVTGIPAEQITGHRRNPAIVRARVLAVVMIYQVKSWWPQARIARCFNFKGHASIIHSLRRHQWWEKELQQYRSQAIALEHQLITTATR